MDASGLGGFVLSASSDVCILWDLANWTKIRSLFAQQAPLLDARFSPACTGIQGGMTRGLMRQDGTGRVAKGSVKISFRICLRLLSMVRFLGRGSIISMTHRIPKPDLQNQAKPPKSAPFSKTVGSFSGTPAPSKLRRNW